MTSGWDTHGIKSTEPPVTPQPTNETARDSEGSRLDRSLAKVPGPAETVAELALIVAQGRGENSCSGCKTELPATDAKRRKDEVLREGLENQDHSRVLIAIDSQKKI